MTQKLLLQKSSGCVYHYSEALAADPDFELYQAKSPKVDPVEPDAVGPAELDTKAMARAVLTKKR